MKEKIKEFNKQFGLNTEFFSDPDIKGYVLGNTIYLSDTNPEDELEKVNKHELLHFFEEDEIFIELKDTILKKISNKIDQLREIYKLRYCDVYTKEEIESGILDTEIAIDLLVEDFYFGYDNGLKLNEYLLTKISENITRKKYLNLSLKKQIQEMNGLTEWDKIFVQNFYDGKNHILTSQKDKRKRQIQDDIEKELNRLLTLPKEEFIIDPNCAEVKRKFQSEIKALEARGEKATYYKYHETESLKEIAESLTNTLYEEYKHIADFIQSTDYEDSFKVLMLRETLSKSYKQETRNGKKETIIKKRIPHESISNHMTLNETVLNVIYKNIDKYDNFTELYFSALEVFNKKIIESNNISLENVDTYGMGHWIRFEGKTSNEDKYIENANDLASLVKDTPWCTKELASTQLAEGDFYVFVDNDNKPHIAVKMFGSEIDEVRGILNGNAQELEEEYRDVALSFLKNNRKVENGEAWLEKEKWNKRLIHYIEAIENNSIKDEEIPQLVQDYAYFKDYKSHTTTNTNKVKLGKLLPRILPQLAANFGCEEKEIHIGNLKFDGINISSNQIKTDEECIALYENFPYKVILGDANFNGLEIDDLDNLEVISGDADFSYTDIPSIKNLRVIGGNANFEESTTKELPNLEYIGGDAIFERTAIKDLSKLETIVGNAEFYESAIENLSSLKSIGGGAEFAYSAINNLDSLESIGDYAYFTYTRIRIIPNLRIIGCNCEKIYPEEKDLGAGCAGFSKSEIESLPNLKIIYGIASFDESKIKYLPNLESIGFEAHFRLTPIEEIPNLKYIGMTAYFGISRIKKLDKLEYLWKADFSYTDLESLPSIKKVDESITITGSKFNIESFPLGKEKIIINEEQSKKER